MLVITKKRKSRRRCVLNINLKQFQIRTQTLPVTFIKLIERCRGTSLSTGAYTLPVAAPEERPDIMYARLAPRHCRIAIRHCHVYHRIASRRCKGRPRIVLMHGQLVRYLRPSQHCQSNCRMAHGHCQGRSNVTKACPVTLPNDA